MSVSLHVKLKELHSFGILELRRDPTRHYKDGEGAYYFNGHPIKVEANIMGQDTDQKDLVKILEDLELDFDRSHDLAWCPALKLMVAYAETPSEEFLISDRKGRIAQLLFNPEQDDLHQNKTRNNYAVV